MMLQLKELVTILGLYEQQPERPILITTSTDVKAEEESTSSFVTVNDKNNRLFSRAPFDPFEENLENLLTWIDRFETKLLANEVPERCWVHFSRDTKGRAYDLVRMDTNHKYGNVRSQSTVLSWSEFFTALKSNFDERGFYQRTWIQIQNLKGSIHNSKMYEYNINRSDMFPAFAAAIINTTNSQSQGFLQLGEQRSGFSPSETKPSTDSTKVVNLPEDKIGGSNRVS
ncbi:hypothetical protein V1514DRAFT_344032 [Lipomyces japonicus]|uniref:uncharacterized protein n=1 Tax=Lipomyces japonicus TaxID=56871 RepID=UPI0034CFBBBA